MEMRTMNSNTLKTLQLTLTRGEGAGRVTVPLESFLGFDLWMSHDLEQLVDRWADMAAPKARLYDRHTTR